MLLRCFIMPSVLEKKERKTQLLYEFWVGWVRRVICLDFFFLLVSFGDGKRERSEAYFLLVLGSEAQDQSSYSMHDNGVVSASSLLQPTDGRDARSPHGRRE